MNSKMPSTAAAESISSCTRRSDGIRTTATSRPMPQPNQAARTRVSASSGSVAMLTRPPSRPSPSRNSIAASVNTPATPGPFMVLNTRTS